MSPRSIPALLCALALLTGCAPAPTPMPMPTPTPSPTPPPPVQTPAPTPSPAPQPLQVPEGLDGYALAFAQLIVETEAEAPDLKFDLIYLDDDAVPELVVWGLAYTDTVSVYQHNVGTLNPVIDRWPYGIEYIPKGNIVRSCNTDTAGLEYIGYDKLGGGRKMESCYEEALSIWMFLDKNNNGLMDEDEPYSDHPYYYYGDREITPEEFHAYLIPGDYQPLVGSQSAACLLAQLQAVAQKEALGLEGQLPYYAYRDEEGDLQLELYFDPDAGTGRGFRYQWEDVDLGVPPSCEAFTFDSAEEGVWEERSPYSVLSVDGTDGSDQVQDYQSSYEYDEEGRPARFRSWGIFESGPIDTRDIIRVEFYYRGDGTLVRKQYYHDGLMFSTTLSSVTTHYDRQERPVYLRGYITHGHLEFYPIYGEGPTPDYCLVLDYMDRPYPIMYRLV